jgi:prophage tail gpP-like protein
VRGQSSEGTGEHNPRIEATSQDTSLGRCRPVVIIEDGDLDQETAQTRADTRRDREAGESLKASGEVRGVRDSAGTNWTPGWLIWTESPFLNLAKLMLIKKMSPWRSSQKKYGRPLNQPVSSNDAYAVGDGYIEPIKRLLGCGSLQ